jgi:toxin ParE1/3/4
MPRRGRKVPEIGDEDIRELIIGDYRLVFEVRDAEQRVDIITVLHGAQRFPLEEFLDD